MPWEDAPRTPVISLLDHIRYELGGTLVAYIAQGADDHIRGPRGLHAAE